jgi:hypothetical protein
MLGRSMRNLTSNGPVGLVVVALLLTPCATSAQQEAPRTAVAPFEGRSARALQRAVAQAIDESVRVVPDDEVGHAAEEAGVEGIGADGVRELASALGAELIVQGSVSGSRRAQRLELVVRAADGDELARGTARYARGRAARRRFSSSVRELVEGAVSAWRSRSPAEPEPIEAPDEPEAPVTPPAAVPDDGLALLSGLIGVGVRNREATIELDPSGRRTYGSGIYAEIAIALEARPFANDAHLGRGLFIQGSFGHSLGLRSENEDLACDSDPAPAGCNVDTSFLRFAIGAGWLAPIGDAVELGAGLTVGYDGYHLATNVVMPTAEYLHIRPGARGRIRLAREALVLDLEVAYRGVIGVGALATSFGEQAGAHGVDVGVGIGGNLIPAMDLGLTWGVRFDYVGYFLSFAGPASDTPGTSGSESAVRLTFLVGWSIR